MNKKILIAFYFISIVVSPQLQSQQETGELSFLQYKSKGYYREALQSLVTWNNELSDQTLLEVNAFRVYELMKYPELTGVGIHELVQLKKRAAAHHWKSLLDRTSILLNQLYLRRGDIKQSESIMQDLGYWGFYRLGPFANSSLEDFNKALPPEKGFHPQQSYQGRMHAVTWHYTAPDRTGSINFPDFQHKVKDSLFYLYNEFITKEKSSYTLTFGRSGLVDIWIDGSKIVTSRDQHKFHPDQYQVNVILNPGRHQLLVKTGSHNTQLCFSLRMLDALGKSIPRAGPLKGGDIVPGTVKAESCRYFHSLAYYLGASVADDSSRFRAGYLAYMTGIMSGNTGSLKNLFLAKYNSLHYSSASLHYLASLTGNASMKSSLLNESFRLNPENAESLAAKIDLELNNKHLDDADETIKKFPSPSAGYPYRLLSLAKLHHKLGWDHETEMAIALARKSPYPSSSEVLGSFFYQAIHDNRRALKHARRLFSKDGYGTASTGRMVHLALRLGKWKLAESLLNRAIHLHPNTISYRLILARLIRNHKNIQEALPPLSSANIIAPRHPLVLKDLGYLYHALGKYAIAEGFLNQALEGNPDDTSLAALMSVHYKKDDPLRKYHFNSTCKELLQEAAPYNNEKAVILLDETIYSVEANGSYEKRRRKIIAINKKSSFADLKNQYIIIEPKTETLQSLKCLLIKEDKIIEITDRFTKSLSDAESSLYYDLEALILPVTGLSEKCIIDMSYVLKNSSGDVYKYLFNKRMTLGSTYRTMHTNVVVAAPSAMSIYSGLKNLLSTKILTEKHQQRTFHRLKVHNLPPMKKEQGMPNESEVLPAAYFSSSPSWSHLANWYLSLMAGRLIMSDEMRSAVDRLISPADSDLEKIRKIYTHVIDEIRYVGFEFGVGSIQPRRTDITYHTRMGDCKDIALLLVAMLRYAGIDARIALVRTRSQGPLNMTIPSMDDFNHALCYVNCDGGFFLDGTVADTDIRELPAEDRGIMALVINDLHAAPQPPSKSNHAFIGTDSAFYEVNNIEIINDISIQGDGSALITRIMTKQGSFASESRRSLKIAESVKLKSLTEYWNKAFPGSSVTAYKVLGDSLRQPVKYRYKLSVPSYAKSIDGLFMVDPFLIKSNYYHNYCLKEKRDYPIQFSSLNTIKTINHFQIPKGYRIDSLPQNKVYSHKKFDAAFTYAMDNGIITVASIISIKDYQITPKEYEQFREFSRLVSTAENSTLIFIKNE